MTAIHETTKPYPAPYVIAAMIWGIGIITASISIIIELLIGWELSSVVIFVLPPFFIGYYLASKRGNYMTRGHRWSSVAWYICFAIVLGVIFIFLDSRIGLHGIVPYGADPVILTAFIFAFLIIVGAPMTYFMLWLGERLEVKATKESAVERGS